MKTKSFLLAALLFISVFIFNSCTKENQLVNNQRKKFLHYTLPDKLKEDITHENGLLKFNDKKTFDEVLSLLEIEDKKWNKAFSMHYSSYTCEEIDSIAEVIGFNENLVYETFENHHSFYSLRAKIAKEEQVWLNNKVLDLDNDPDNHHIVGNEYRSVINENSELMIGKSIYKIKENWTVYEITDGNFATLKQLRNGYLKSKSPDLHNVIIHNSEDNLKGSDNCKSNHSDTEYENYKTDYLLKARLTITNSLFGHFVKAESWKYKRKRRRWRKKRGIHCIAIWGNVRIDNCSGDEYSADINGCSNDDKHYSLKNVANGKFVAKSGAISSKHTIDGIYAEKIVLNWP